MSEPMKPIAEPFDPVKHADVKPWVEFQPCGLCTEEPLASVCAHHARALAPALTIFSRRLDGALAAMRKEGQGLSLGQETEIRYWLGLL